MRIRIITYILLMLSLSVTAQTKRALVIGLGEQQDKAWNKINGDKDVPFVQAMLKNAGFKSVTTLVNRQATKVGIVGAFKRMAASCKHGDVVYIHYSGHGQQMTDVHNDEKDGLDECWIPYDACRKASATYHGEKHLTDDELNVYLNAIRNKIGAKGKLLVVIDACHSGDGTRGDDDDIVRGVEDTLVVDSQNARGLYETFEAIKSFFMSDNGKENIINTKAKPLAERWITISACRSDQVNVEMKSPAVGKLTYALWKELKNSDKVNNDEFMRRIRKFVNRNTCSRPQQPEMTGEDINKYNITDILSR
ncbi:caspase family protein [uncultured Prevotella sp.]|uniref:caspase family protein n=1 Tax=uncultured Prevotella sp. TaxID=159272 RepID=UPI0025972563|nr:caspase family protein [uncultured Prevotella sp.]